MPAPYTQETFESAVDAACERKFGLGVDELVGDWPSGDLFADGATVAQAVAWIEEESGIQAWAWN